MGDGWDARETSSAYLLGVVAISGEHDEVDREYSNKAYDIVDLQLCVEFGKLV